MTAAMAVACEQDLYWSDCMETLHWRKNTKSYISLSAKPQNMIFKYKNWNRIIYSAF